MKRIIALVMLAVMFSANAFAQAVDQNGARLTATLGDQDSAKNYRLQCDVNGLCEWAQGTAIAYGYENIASGTALGNVVGAPGSGYSLTSADSGLNISDYGGITAGTSAPGTKTGFGTRYILPACSTANLGLQFDISTAIQETITVTPLSSADSLAWSLSGTGVSAGVGIKNSGTKQAGDEVQVSCTSVGNWTIKNLYGTWATSS